MSSEYKFTKENLDTCFRALAREYRRLVGKTMPAELTLIGGASVLINYGFRDVTYDIDAIIEGSSAMRDAITKVGDDFGLPAGWLNSDFKKTLSYTTKLLEHSVYYKTFSNILTIRTISSEYLVAMKLMSSRKYKNDISDIAGILAEQKKSGNPLSLEKIKAAVTDLYGGCDKIPDESWLIIESIIQKGNPEELYEIYRNQEKANKEALIDFEHEYPGVTTVDNVNDIINALKNRKK